MRPDAPQRVYDPREDFNGLRWIVRAGAPWRLLPTNVPPWEAVYQQTRRWLEAGCFEDMTHDLRALLRWTEGRADEPSAVILDSATRQSSPESGARAGWDGHKRRKGSTIHLAVDTLGHLLALRVTPANEQERAHVGALAAAVQQVTGQTVELAFVDQGSTGPESRRRAVAQGFGWRWSRCPRPSAVSCCCPAVGWSSAPLPGPLAFGGWPGIRTPAQTVEGVYFVAVACLMLHRLSPSPRKVHNRL